LPTFIVKAEPDAGALSVGGIGLRGQAERLCDPRGRRALSQRLLGGARGQGTAKRRRSAAKRLVSAHQLQKRELPDAAWPHALPCTRRCRRVSWLNKAGSSIGALGSGSLASAYQGADILCRYSSHSAQKKSCGCAFAFSHKWHRPCADSAALWRSASLPHASNQRLSRRRSRNGVNITFANANTTSTPHGSSGGFSTPRRD